MSALFISAKFTAEGYDRVHVDYESTALCLDFKNDPTNKNKMWEGLQEKVNLVLGVEFEEPEVHLHRV